MKMAVLFHVIFGRLLAALKYDWTRSGDGRQLQVQSLTQVKLQWTRPSNLKEKIRVMTRQWKEGEV
jgi:hypothetical protein